MRPLIVLALVAAPILVSDASAQNATPAVHLAPHRAIYELSLARSGGAHSLEAARGRIVFDFTGDDCQGYALQYRQVTVLESGESGTRSSDLRNVTFESGDGKSFRFKTDSQSGSKTEAVDGNAEVEGTSLQVRLRQPKRESFDLPGPALFPTAHMKRLIEAAHAGTTTLTVKVFDGSEDGHKVYDTLAVIGRRIESAPSDSIENPLRTGPMATIPRWPVTLSYFAQGQGERTPVYILSFDLYENGVSRGLRLDYGEFALKGDLSAIDLLPEKACQR